MSLFDFLFGSQSKQQNIETLTPEQQNLFGMLQQALSGQGDSSNPFFGALQHLTGLASGDEKAMSAFTDPMQRQFSEQTMPDLAARFAGMGSGGAFSGSGFRGAAMREGSNLAERMQAIRSQMQSQAAGQLPGFFSQATSPQFQPGMTTPTTGLIPGMAVGFAQGAGKAMGGGF